MEHLNIGKQEQSGIGTVTLGAGNLDLVINDAVTSVAFADNSAQLGVAI